MKFLKHVDEFNGEVSYQVLKKEKSNWVDGYIHYKNRWKNWYFLPVSHSFSGEHMVKIANFMSKLDDPKL